MLYASGATMIRTVWSVTGQREVTRVALPSSGGMNSASHAHQVYNSTP
jgi:hypothetical protein